MTILIAALAGLVFGLGLLLSGMADPQRVRGFLDLFGAAPPAENECFSLCRMADGTALRDGVLPRWLGWASVVLGTVTALTGISPLQYLAGFTGPVWVLVCAVGIWFATDRR